MLGLIDIRASFFLFFFFFFFLIFGRTPYDIKARPCATVTLRKPDVCQILRIGALSSKL